MRKSLKCQFAMPVYGSTLYIRYKQSSNQSNVTRVVKQSDLMNVINQSIELPSHQIIITEGQYETSLTINQSNNQCEGEPDPNSIEQNHDADQIMLFIFALLICHATESLPNQSTNQSNNQSNNVLATQPTTHRYKPFEMENFQWLLEQLQHQVHHSMSQPHKYFVRCTYQPAGTSFEHMKQLFLPYKPICISLKRFSRRPFKEYCIIEFLANDQSIRPSLQQPGSSLSSEQLMHQTVEQDHGLRSAMLACFELRAMCGMDRLLAVTARSFSDHSIDRFAVHCKGLSVRPIQLQNLISESKHEAIEQYSYE